MTRKVIQMNSDIIRITKNREDNSLRIAYSKMKRKYDN